MSTEPHWPGVPSSFDADGALMDGYDIARAEARVAELLPRFASAQQPDATPPDGQDDAASTTPSQAPSLEAALDLATQWWNLPERTRTDTFRGLSTAERSGLTKALARAFRAEFTAAMQAPAGGDRAVRAEGITDTDEDLDDAC